MIPDDKIPEIRERTDIVALVQQYVPLKRVGASFKGLCPFHAEKSPSFHVHAQRQFFHCFGCQASGDVLSFYMRIEGVSFPEALRALAEKAGVEIPVVDGPAQADDRRQKARRERLAALMDAAAGFYVKQLGEHALSGMARAELEARGVSPDSAQSFRLGYAPHGWDSLTTWLKTSGHSLAEAEELGLVVPRKSGTGHYDRFRHRLMFPVTDHAGRIVAFSGRVLDPPPDEPLSDRMEAAAKYMNSPESPLFHKGSVLFGLHEGRVDIRREGWVIVCEGNFDLVGLHQSGFRNSVAPLGTAFTDEHVRLLKRFAGRVVLLFDGDKAGQKAVRSAYPLLQAHGLSASVVRLPEGQDPDSFLRAEGADALRRRIDAAPNIVEHLIDDAAATASGDPAQKAAAIETLGPILRAVGNPVEVGLYVERVARKFGIADLESVRAQLRRGVKKAAEARPTRTAARPAATMIDGADPMASEHDPQSESSARRSPTPGSPTPGAQVAKEHTFPVRPAPQVPLPAIECDLLGVLLDCPALLAAEEATRLEALLTSADLRIILGAARQIVAQHGTLVGPALVDSVRGSAALPWLTSRLATQVHESATAPEALRRGLAKLAADHVAFRLPQMSEEIQALRRAGDEERAMVLTQERDRLFRSTRNRAHEATHKQEVTSKEPVVSGGSAKPAGSAESKGTP